MANVSATSPERLADDPRGDASPDFEHLDLLALDAASGDGVLTLTLALADVAPERLRSDYLIEFHTPATLDGHPDQIQCHVGLHTLAARSGPLDPVCRLTRIIAHDHSIPGVHMVESERFDLEHDIDGDRASFSIQVPYALLEVGSDDIIEDFRVFSLWCPHFCVQADDAPVEGTYVLG